MSRSIPPFSVVPSLVLLYLIKSLSLLLPSLVRQIYGDFSRFRVYISLSRCCLRPGRPWDSIQRDGDSLGLLARSELVKRSWEKGRKGTKSPDSFPNPPSFPLPYLSTCTSISRPCTSRTHTTEL